MPTFIVRIPVSVHDPSVQDLEERDPMGRIIRDPGYHTRLEVAVECANEREAVAVLASELSNAGIGAFRRQEQPMGCAFRLRVQRDLAPYLNVPSEGEYLGRRHIMHAGTIGQLVRLHDGYFTIRIHFSEGTLLWKDFEFSLSEMATLWEQVSPPTFQNQQGSEGAKPSKDRRTLYQHIMEEGD